MSRLRVKVCTGKEFAIRDFLDLRVYVNNYIGFTATLLGYGLRVRFDLRREMKRFTEGDA